tara:strand:- start:290 stop:412 length:123 start_codon:yes stop_codon:yes gene_type:complete
MAKAPVKKKEAAKAAPSTRVTRSGMIRTIGKKATLGKRAM